MSFSCFSFLFFPLLTLAWLSDGPMTTEAMRGAYGLRGVRGGTENVNGEGPCERGGECVSAAAC